MKRSDENPILIPQGEAPWEAEAAFNGCPVRDRNTTHLLYRALSSSQKVWDQDMQISSIGIAESRDGVHFRHRRQLVKPDREWDRFGCEDPRVTKLNGTYYIFYTALSAYPFRPEGIKVGLAITKDLKKVNAKYPVTPFNAKAMALFPEKIGGKIAAVLTANTDMSPARAAIAFFESEKDIWSREFWETWQRNMHHFALPLARDPKDHIEIGAPPLKTKHGWLLIYSYIQHYFSPPSVFGVEAVLLDLNHPFKVIARTQRPLLVPEALYEKYGKVPNIVFPSGALIQKKKLHVYYGAADTSCALASGKLQPILNDMLRTKAEMTRLMRYPGNPIITPDPDRAWKRKAACNPAALAAGNNVHILYRAMSEDNTSTFGYAASRNGFSITELPPDPVYTPRASFEQKLVPGGNSGCEDPRLTKIGTTVYLCYTAYDGAHPPRVALSSISFADFTAKRWTWSAPKLISPPGMDDKDAALFPKKFNGKFAILHRLNGEGIWLDYVNDLNFDGSQWIKGDIIMKVRTGPRDSRKIGIAAPPLETKKGWLLLYHGISKKEDHHYHVRAALLDLKNPAKVISRTTEPILETEMPYEKEGQVANVVFPCGAVIIQKRLFVYYGCADTVVGVASVGLDELLQKLEAEKIKN
ncbi:hypothetical protein HYR65_04235 [Candidatus Azambacteria bacterium]|nr:hypothetical protein [Candidatus Azambacteria bacterium]